MKRPAGFILAFSLVVASGVLVGCSGRRPYVSNLANNLNVSANLKSGSLLSTSAPLVATFGADMHVIGLDRHCQKTYRGSVKLGSAAAKVGLPTDQPTLLVFEFSGHSFLTRGSGSSTYSTLLTPRSGYQYDAMVSYASEMYQVAVHERNPRNGQRREVDHRPFSACKVG